MKKMLPQKNYTKDQGEDFSVALRPGDVFISFHHTSGSCLGHFLPMEHLLKTSIEKLQSDVATHFKNDFKALEIKVIGALKSIDQVLIFFGACEFSIVKKVEKSTAVEIHFLPLMNKVRVSIEALPTALEIVPTPAAAPVAALAKEMEKIKVLIVDDSKTIRNILSRIFSSDDRFVVCAMAEKPSEVEGLILKFKPDVITLDIHMPEMDGVALLKIISPKYHIPTVMISSISMAEGPMVLEALESGAIDYIQKPDMSEIGNVTPLILEKVRTAAMANMSKKTKKVGKVKNQTKEVCGMDSLIVLGSSTGGTEAIRDILTALPDQIPPMLIVQHIPAVFSAAFAKRMNDLCSFEVKEAANGDEVLKNRVLIAPGGQQMKMVHKNGKTYVEINDDEPVNRFKPSVDYLFFSVAKNLYTQTVAVILTGMGKDGAKGMLELRNAGVRTIAQNEETSVVFGMPKEAINIGGAEFIEPLPEIAERITVLTSQKKTPLKRTGN